MRQGAAQDNEITNYVNQNLPKAKSGEILRSNYFKGLYDLFSKSTYSDKGFQMNIIADFIDKAEALESNKITFEEYESFRRKQNAKIAMHDEAAGQQQSQNSARRPLVDIKPLVPYQMPINKTTNCTSNRVGDTVYTNCR